MTEKLALRNVAVFNTKGGEGKTTTAHALAEGLQRSGLQVLAVDLDPQANLTTRWDIERPEITLFEVVQQQNVTIGNAILDLPGGVRLIPSAPRVNGLSAALYGQPGAERWLRRQLATIPPSVADVVILDLPPGRDMCGALGIAASQIILATTEPCPMGKMGLDQLFPTLGEAMEDNPDLLLWVVPVRIDRRTRLIPQMLDEYRRALAGRISSVAIPVAVALKEADGERLPIYDHAPQSAAAKAYGALTAEVLGILRSGRLPEVEVLQEPTAATSGAA